MLAIPAGQCGDWRVVHKVLTDKEARRLNWDTLRKSQSIAPPDLLRFVEGGVYTSLCRGDVPVMSDHKFEVQDSARFAKIAYGRVLVSGLGLGVVLGQLAENPLVSSVTVLEKSPEVIKLVASHVGGRILHADTFEWRPGEGERFDWAWHDIWDTINVKNVVEMIRLYQHHKPWAKRQLFWSWPQIVMKVHCDIERAALSGPPARHRLLVSLLGCLELWNSRLWPDGRGYLEIEEDG